MDSENKKLKHLEFIQRVINRMSANPFLLKGWSVTLVAALFALAAKDANKKYIIVAFLPVVVFWIVDAYFLSQERSFRGLYDDVRMKQDGTDFSTAAKRFGSGKNSWASSLLSQTLLAFYLSLAGMMLLVMYLIK